MSCAILAHEREAVDKIFQIVKRAYENIPDEFKPKVNKDTERAYRFESMFDGTPLDSEIYVALKLRSTTVQWLHITESAYIKNRQELEAGSKQAVPVDGRITEETTGNGFNEFYDSYMRYHTKTNKTPYDYRTYFYGWHENPEYALPATDDFVLTTDEQDLVHRVEEEYNRTLTNDQLSWRRWKMDDLRREANLAGLTGNQLFKQEYPSTLMEAFQSGAGAVFDLELVEKIVPREPIFEDYGYTKWVEPDETHRYVVGCDPSDGSVDFGVIDVWDITTFEQVAQFKGKLRPDELAEKIKDIAVEYNRAFVGVENNLLSTVLFLSKIYDNIYYTTTIDERTQKQTKKLGYNTNTKSRDLMIDEFVVGFEDGSAKINSKATIGEMRTFVRKDNGKREHADGKHDDCLFAAFIAWQMRKYHPGAMVDAYKNLVAR